MKSYNSISVLAEAKCRSCTFSLFIVTSLICGAYFVGSAWLGRDSSRLSPGLVVLNIKDQYTQPVNCEYEGLKDTQVNDTQVEKCNDKCRPIGSESLPKGIVSSTSDFEMHPLSGPVTENNQKNPKHTTSLLALAVGIKQKTLVNQIVTKFLERAEFVIMLFHYDSIVDKWHEFEWSDRAIHVSASNQTKWWFAKRFLHPDIVAEYEYIFLWDEDLDVENFNPQRYLSIIKEEGLEISQPALDGGKSEVHHHITVRSRRSKLHRRYFRPRKCDANSTAPPCAGWVEMMAPVFSREAWRCSWYMIQNDLIHAWGLDMQLGYCAQGDRAVKVGVVDEQYVVHLGVPTLGGANSDKNNTKNTNTNTNTNTTMQSKDRYAIRLRSYDEMRAFRNRWDKAIEEDKCWIDPFKQNSTEMV